MTHRSLIAISVIFFSCNARQVEKRPVDPVSGNDSTKKAIVTTGEPTIQVPADTTSTDYLMYLLKNEKALNDPWTSKLKKLGEFVLPLDSMSHLSITRDWVINDSISAIILAYGTGVSLDEYLLTIKNKKDIISKVHIKDAADADVTDNNPDYFYMEYQQVDDRTIKLMQHIIRNYDTEKEKDSITAIEHWLIRDNGKAIKK